MAEDQPTSPTPLTDYDAIERAVAETERGRWFLKEFARRTRLADTGALMAAIGRLETVLERERHQPEAAPIRVHLVAMAELIAQTKHRLSAAPLGSPGAAEDGTLPGVARTADQVAAILAASADRLRESAASLRAQGARSDLCDAVDRQAREIATAAAAQRQTVQRVAALAEALDDIDRRVDGLIGLRSGSIAPPPDDRERLDAEPDRRRPSRRGKPRLVT